jgi:hypothetical protein
MAIFNSLTGWWYTYTSEKYEFVSWDDYSQYMGKNKTHVPNHQPGQLVRSSASKMLLYHPK